MFDHEWFTGRLYTEQHDEARWRCALRRFPKLTRENALDDSDFNEFWDAMRTRTLVYLRDGFSYEIKEVADVASRSHLTFECEPVDDQYKVGSFVVSVPYDDVVRVEVFAVPEDEMPEDMPSITGFRSKAEPPGQPPQPPS